MSEQPRHPDFVLLDRCINKALSLLDKMKREIEGADDEKNSHHKYFIPEKIDSGCVSFRISRSNSPLEAMSYFICKRMPNIFGYRYLIKGLERYKIHIIDNIVSQEEVFVISARDLHLGKIPDRCIESITEFNLWLVGIFIELITEIKKSFDEITEAIYSD